MFIDTQVEILSGIKQVATPQQMGISARELEALLEVREMLSSGALRYSNVHDEPMGPVFNMARSRYKTECGTVCCIGGWMAEIMKLDSGVTMGMMFAGPMQSLFHPLWSPVPCTQNLSTYAHITSLQGLWGRITTEQAVQAIDNFTIHTPGQAGWEQILEFTK
jgi:hypothetical protein